MNYLVYFRKYLRLFLYVTLLAWYSKRRNSILCCLNSSILFSVVKASFDKLGRPCLVWQMGLGFLFSLTIWKISSYNTRTSASRDKNNLYECRSSQQRANFNYETASQNSHRQYFGEKASLKMLLRLKRKLHNASFYVLSFWTWDAAYVFCLVNHEHTILGELHKNQFFSFRQDIGLLEFTLFSGIPALRAEV